MEVINLKPDDYYKQTNNQVRPGLSCTPTSTIMFWLGNKIPFTSPSDFTYSQPEDNVTEACLTENAWKRCYELSPWIKDYNIKNPTKLIYPYENPYLYPDYIDPLFCSKTISKFIINCTYNMVLDYLNKGKIVLTTAKFPEAGIKGHTFCIIGYKDEKTLYLGDPYGNYHNLFKANESTLNIIQLSIYKENIV
jgi:hypothetical protein